MWLECRCARCQESEGGRSILVHSCGPSMGGASRVSPSPLQRGEPRPPPHRFEGSEPAVFARLRVVPCVLSLDQRQMEEVPLVSLTSNFAESQTSSFFSWVCPAHDFSLAPWALT